jgi:beta-galactosidase
MRAACLTMSFLAVAFLCMAFSAQASAASNSRTVVVLSEGWKFRLEGPAPAAPDSSGENWQDVTVPHTWNRVGYYLTDPDNHINRVDNINKTQGVGWYELTFAGPSLEGDHRAWLQFDAAGRTAEVWLNGVRLGEHRGAFSRFRFDATAALRPGQNNELLVKVDNTQPSATAPTPATYPLTGDFFIHGGLYRPVSLIVTDQVHVDMLDHGGPGAYATTRSVTRGLAHVDVTTRVRNSAAGPATVRLVSRLIDARGRSVAKAEETLSLAPGSVSEPLQQLRIRRARLWQGVADPYLYTLRTEVRSATGDLLDVLDQSFGIRTLRLDPDRGFILNDQPVRLHGVGMHQDWEGKGWAISRKDVEDTVAIMRDMGANTLRLAHYQHGQPIHDLADRTGMILWDEIGLVTAWTLGEDAEPSPDLLANGRQQLRELIKQNFNHASVAAWGLANEVDFGPGRPDFLGRPPANVPDPLPLLAELHALAKSEDPSRPTVIANCCEDRGMTAVPEVADAADASGVNRYFGWYYGRPEELGAHLDRLHAKRPAQPLAVSEYGAGGDVTLHTDNPLGGPVDMAGRVQPEEYLSWLHEESWKQLAARTYLWGSWAWNGFDFATTVRREGESQDINTKGIVTYDRQIKKDVFYFYRANWSADPTVYITGRRYRDRAYPVTEVRVYSSAPVTTLTVNGVALGSKASCPDKVCVWPAVRLSPGENQIAARGDFPEGREEDQIVWNLGEESARAFRIDSGAIIAADSQLRFGSDHWFDGGVAGSADSPGGRGRTAVTAAIVASLNRDIAATFREGDFHYRLPLEQGGYTVTLTFVEPKEAADRSFNVLANGQLALQAFDVTAAAGGHLTEVRRSFEVTVGEEGLDLHFQPITGNGIVSGVEVVPSR